MAHIKFGFLEDWHQKRIGILQGGGERGPCHHMLKEREGVKGVEGVVTLKHVPGKENFLPFESLECFSLKEGGGERMGGYWAAARGKKRTCTTKKP